MEDKPKRKYVKRSKMLLRSNNDYIDHNYWPEVRAKSEKNHARMMAKYGLPDIRERTEPANLSPQTIKFNKEMGMGRHFQVVPNPETKRIEIVDDV